MASIVVGPLLTGSRPLTPTEITTLAGNTEWSLGTLEPPPIPVIPGTGNAQTVSFELVRSDKDNGQTDALTTTGYNTNSGLIDLNHDREIKTQANLNVRDPSLLAPYVDFVAVWLNREWDDGRTVQRDQLGLFGIRVPPGTRTVERADAVYTGYDLTATLARYAFTEAYNIAASANYVTAVLDILDLAGFTRAAIEPTSTVTPAVVSFSVGTTYLAACNTLLQSIGYYTLACLPDGTFFSMPTRPLHLVEPYRVITDDDLMAPVEEQPLDTTVANVVIVVKDQPNAAPLSAIRRNDDADSPTSTVNLGVIVRTESRGDLADQAAVDALADRLLSEGKTFYQTAKLTILPDPRVLVPHQTIRLQLSGKLEILNGIWWMRTGRVPLNTRATQIEINRVTDAIKGVLI